MDSEVLAILEEIAVRGGHIYENEEGRVVISPPGFIDDELRVRMNQCRSQLETFARKNLLERVQAIFGNLLICECPNGATESPESTSQESLNF